MKHDTLRTGTGFRMIWIQSDTTNDKVCPLSDHHSIFMNIDLMNLVQNGKETN